MKIDGPCFVTLCFGQPRVVAVSILTSNGV